jgi:hypothetical protein
MLIVDPELYELYQRTGGLVGTEPRELAPLEPLDLGQVLVGRDEGRAGPSYLPEGARDAYAAEPDITV